MLIRPLGPDSIVLSRKIQFSDLEKDNKHLMHLKSLKNACLIKFNEVAFLHTTYNTGA